MAVDRFIFTSIAKEKNMKYFTVLLFFFLATHIKSFLQ